jgi:hypothetical protein
MQYLFSLATSVSFTGKGLLGHIFGPFEQQKPQRLDEAAEVISGGSEHGRRTILFNHMNASEAERCLRNIARLVTPLGYLFVSGVDLNILTKVAKE